MKKPVLVIMAAGMGSRYGGLKQIDPVDEQGHIIMDFSLYDAKRAGSRKLVFIIKLRMKKILEKYRKPYGTADGSGICVPGTDQSSGRISGSGRPG